MAVMPATVGAQGIEPPSQNGALELIADYTILKGVSGDSFEFTVLLKYTNQEAQTFDLTATGPQGWQISITPSYPRNTKIGNIRLEPGIRETIVIRASTLATTAPGTYDINFLITDTDLTKSLQLQVIINARYSLILSPYDRLFSAKAQVGKDNSYSLIVQNQGSAAVNNIVLSSLVPTDWIISFNPETIRLLAASQEQTVKMVVRPPQDTPPGDYQITLSATGNEAISNSLDFRLTVEKPSIWGWVGISVVALFVICIALVLIRMNRR